MPKDYSTTLQTLANKFQYDFSDKAEQIGYCLTFRSEIKEQKISIIASAEYISWKQLIWKNGSKKTRQQLEALIGQEFKCYIGLSPNKKLESFPVKINYTNSQK